ncbi:MAG: chemotaxis protein CheB [Candidatus Marinimicrobia bacterium]|nr:chemotaxis protein CheB [Candidatus Neomarinimicrobiota bacterium]
MSQLKCVVCDFPFDYFLRSLAEERQEKSIGVILFGHGIQTAVLGLKAIKEKNGIVLIQDPLTAKFDGMPRSAINAVTADILRAVSDPNFRQN